VESGRLSLQADKLETARTISQKEQELERLKSEKDLNPSAIVNLQVEIENYQRGFALLEDLEEELFPDEE